jgi:uroporphyrinogen decarboxylase
MTPRERWVNTFTFKPVDRIPHEEFGYWSETLVRWHGQGLPADIDSDWKADRFFGFDPRDSLSVSTGMYPGFDYQVIEEKGSRRIIRDGDGAVCEVFTDGTSSIPRFIEYGIKTRDDWPRYRERLNPDTPGRYPDDWDAVVARSQNRDCPLGIHMGGFYGSLRSWTGVERLSELFYEDPELVHEMMEAVCECMIGAAKRALETVQLDYASFWEDMAYNAGPLISPKHFEEFMVPRYKRVTGLLAAHGVKLNIVDCDGNINALAPLWLKSGVNIMFPIEARAGTDPFEMRRRYGRDVLLLGGVDKMQLMRGRGAIDRELERLKPLVEQGGFIPHVDHRVPPDIPYADYRYYLERKKRVLLGLQEQP